MTSPAVSRWGRGESPAARRLAARTSRKLDSTASGMYSASDAVTVVNTMKVGYTATSSAPVTPARSPHSSRPSAKTNAISARPKTALAQWPDVGDSPSSR